MADDTGPTKRTPKQLILKGIHIREDVNGLICLDDIWRAAKATPGREPRRWRDIGATKRLENALQQKVATAALKAKREIIPVAYAKRGRGNAGTFAHPILAAAYAGYLEPKLAIEIKEVWLRYRAGDPTLADEILERASDDANRWVAARAQGRIQRRRFTDVLKAAAVSSRGYGLCTNAIYRRLFDRTAQQIKASRNVLVARDAMDVVELAQVMLSEGMAAERIEEENRKGDIECIQASDISASFVRKAVDEERGSRRPRLPI